MTSTGFYEPSSVSSLSDGDASWLPVPSGTVPANLVSEDALYAGSDFGDGESFEIIELRLVFAGTPNTDNVYSTPIAVTGSEANEDVTFFGSGAVIPWTGGNPTAADVRSSFGFDIQYFGTDEELILHRLRPVFDFTAGLTPVSIGATIDKITLRARHYRDGGSEQLMVNNLAMAIEFTEATTAKVSQISRYF